MTNTHGLHKNYVLSGFQKFQKRCDRSYGTQKASPQEIMTQICPNGIQNDIFFSSKALHQDGKTNTRGLDKNYILSGFQKLQKRYGRSHRAQKASSCGIVTQICPNGSQNDLFWKMSVRRPFVMTIKLGLMDFKNNFLLPSL